MTDEISALGHGFLGIVTLITPLRNDSHTSMAFSDTKLSDRNFKYSLSHYRDSILVGYRLTGSESNSQIAERKSLCKRHR